MLAFIDVAANGDLSIEALPVAVKLIGLVVGIVVAFVALRFLPALLAWFGRMMHTDSGAGLKLDPDNNYAEYKRMRSEGWTPREIDRGGKGNM